MKNNITELENLLNHYRDFYEFVIMCAFSATFMQCILSEYPTAAGINTILLLILVWYNYRKVRKIKIRAKKFEILLENVTTDSEKA